MATSGSVDSGGYQGRVLRFSWGTNSVSGNTRNIWYEVKAVGGSSSIYYHHNETVDLNGTRIYTGSDSHSVRTGDVLASGNMSINQNNTSTLTVDMHGGIYSRTDNINTSQSWTLDTLIQAPSINSLALKSRTINSLTFNFTCSKADNWYYKLSSQTSWTQGSSTGVTSGEFTITGLNPNTGYTIDFIARNWAGNEAKDASKNVTGTTYDIAKLVSVPDVNIGSKQTITWTNPSGAATTLKLCKTDNSQIANIGTVTGTSKDYTANASTIYALTPNSNEYTARYIITTTQNSQSYTNSKDFKFKVTNSNPTFSNFTYQDTNSTTIALTGNNQILVKGYSKVKAIVSTANKATAKNSATMKTYKLVIGSQSTTSNYSSTADVSLPANGTVSVDSGTLTVYATDSRANSTSVAKNATYKQYSDLTIKSVTTIRDSNGVGKGVTLSFNGSYWAQSFGKVTNTIKSVVYQYRNSNSNTWNTGTTTLTYTQSNGNYSGSLKIKGEDAEGFNISNAYIIRLTVKDELSTKIYDTTLSSGTPAIAIYKSNVAIGQKYDTSEGSKLQVAGSINIPLWNSSYKVNGKPLLASTGTNAILSGNGDTVYLRPNGPGSTSGQAYLDIYGNLDIIGFYKHYFTGVINPATWYYIGDFELGAQGRYAVIQGYYGNGQNGRADQQVLFTLTMMQGFAENSSIRNNIGLTVNFEQNYLSSLKFKIIQSSTENCSLYIYLPVAYNSLSYIITGTARRFTYKHQKVSAEPTGGKNATIYHLSEVLNIYPVGAIYLSVNNTSPASLFGGTWEQLKDRFLVGAGNSYAVNATGGSSTVNISHNHTSGSLKAAIGAVNGNSQALGYNPTGAIAGVGYLNGYGATGNPGVINSVEHATPIYGTTDNGGSTSLENRPPYLAVYMWKRTK